MSLNPEKHTQLPVNKDKLQSCGVTAGHGQRGNKIDDKLRRSLRRLPAGQPEVGVSAAQLELSAHPPILQLKQIQA